MTGIYDEYYLCSLLYSVYFCSSILNFPFILCHGGGGDDCDGGGYDGGGDNGDVVVMVVTVV
jgi:hypothetical protein